MSPSASDDAHPGQKPQDDTAPNEVPAEAPNVAPSTALTGDTTRSPSTADDPADVGGHDAAMGEGTGEGTGTGGGTDAVEPAPSDDVTAPDGATVTAGGQDTGAATAELPAARAPSGPGGQPGHPGQGAQAQAKPKTEISCSGGFAQWMQRNAISIAFSSYQSGQLFLVGAAPNGQVTFHQHGFGRAMGLWADRHRIYMATSSQIWRLENVLREGETANKRFDRLFVPRNAQTVGPVDIHEVGVEPSGRIIFVNTKHSCLGTLSLTHGFRPIWKPFFISKLAPEDRCHLNGLGMEQGRARYVTAVCRSDVIAGWRERRSEGGLIIDLNDDQKLLTEGLSMPHSPRVWQGQLYVLNSGRGQLCRVDRQTGAIEEVAFMPGFLRGLSFVNNFAIATLSLPRDKSFAGLQLDDELAKRDADAWCGIQVIDLNTGDVVHWVRLKGGPIRELFDVTVLPGVRTPMASGSIAGGDAHITWEREFGLLHREAAPQAQPAAVGGGAA
ncbi:MAG: TIGR03032 family protein [Pseudomonadota bacterium]